MSIISVMIRFKVVEWLMYAAIRPAATPGPQEPHQDGRAARDDYQQIPA
jgi:hypothetical protein